jgi:hypothetical protein
MDSLTKLVRTVCRDRKQWHEHASLLCERRECRELLAAAAVGVYSGIYIIYSCRGGAAVGGLRSGRGSDRGSDVRNASRPCSLYSVPRPRFCGLPVDLAATTTTAIDPAPPRTACVHRPVHPPPRPPPDPVRELRPAPLHHARCRPAGVPCVRRGRAGGPALYMCAWAVGEGDGLDRGLRRYMDGDRVGLGPGRAVVSELVARRGCLRTRASSGASESARRIYAYY